MPPVKPNSKKPETQTAQKPATGAFKPQALYEFNHQTARQAIAQLKNSNRQLIIIPPFEFERAFCQQSLVAYFNAHRDLINYLKTPFKDIRQLNQVKFLNELDNAINKFVLKEKELEELEKAVVPTQEKLLVWQQELKQWEKTVQEAQKRDVNVPNYGDLKTQIERIQKFNYQLEKTAEGHLNKYLTPQEKEEVLNKVSNHLARGLINEGEVNENTAWWLLDELCDKDPQVATALSNEARDNLSHQLVAIVKPEQVKQITIAQNAVNQAAIALAPERDELITRVEQTLGISPTQAQRIVNSLEAVASPTDTLIERRAQFQKALSFQTAIAVQRKGLTDSDFNPLLHTIDCYIKALPLAQSQGWNLPVSKNAIGWAKQLNSEPVVVENLLRGVSSNRVNQEIKALQQGITARKRAGLNYADLEVKLKRLASLQEKLIIFEKRLSNLPVSLRRQINLARLKPSLQDFLTRINPFSWGFYQFHFPKVASGIDLRIQAFNNFYNHVEKKTVFGLVLNPRYHYARHLRWRWMQWAKLVKKVQNRRARKFLYRLPEKFHLSYWVRPGYWLRRSTGKLLLWAGKKLGQRAVGFALRKAGEQLLNFGIKELLGKGLAVLIGSAAGPVGAAIGLLIGAVSFIFDTLRFITSPQGRQVIGTLFNYVAKTLGGALLFLYFLFLKFPFTFLLGTAGFMIAAPFGMAPLGAFMGGAIGLTIDTITHAAGGLSQALSGLTQGLTAGAGGAGTLASTTATSSALVTTTSVGVVGSLAVVTTAVVINYASNSSAFILPSFREEFTEPEEAKYLIITKQATPQVNVGANKEVTYTITLNSKAEKITNIKIIDKIDTSNLDVPIIESGGSFDPNLGTITWTPNDLEGIGTKLSLSYKTKTKAQINNKTKITNTVTASAIVNGETITRMTSVTLNSDGSEIAQRARQIVQNLKQGFWNYYNYSPDYKELFDNAEYNCCNDTPGYLPRHNHCYRSSNYPANCSGNPAAISRGESLFWCSWLVVKSYNETGHSMPPYLAVGTMKDWFEQNGKFLSASTDVAQLDLGYAILFTAPTIEDNGKTTYWAHVGVICGLDNRNNYIEVCESNNYAPIIKYMVSGGIVQGEGRLSIGGFGKP